MRATITGTPRVDCVAGVIGKTLLRTALLFGVASCMPSFAHHSFAMFDQTRRVTLTGTVTEWQWTNPHSELFIMLESQDGTSSQAGGVWRLESDSPAVLRKDFELRRDMVKVGDKVTVVVNPLREGTPGGHIISFTLSDGITRVRHQ